MGMWCINITTLWKVYHHIVQISCHCDKISPHFLCIHVRKTNRKLKHSLGLILCVQI